MQILTTRICNVMAWRHPRLRAHWLMALVGEEGAEGEVCILRSLGIALSFVYGRSLWAELNGEENSLHWKVYMLPLFSIKRFLGGREHVWEVFDK